VEWNSVDKKFDCEQLADHLAEYLDADKRSELCRAIEEHMRHCHDCQVQVDSVKKTIILYQADGMSEIPVTASSKLRAALSRAYDHPSV
jgi:predicted anti-sigma-YlaC factor YlaD